MASIPANLRAPILATVFDSSRAFQGPALLEYKALLIGGRISTGSGAEKTIDLVTSSDEVGALHGFGSEIHRMAIGWFKNNKFTKVYVTTLDDAGAGVVATGTITVIGTATASGTIALYIGGRQINVGVSVGDTATVVGDAIVAAIGNVVGDNKEYPVISANVAGVVTVTAKNKGEGGNSITIRENLNSGEVTPAGVTTTIVAMASGATNPDIQEIIDILGDEWYNVFVAPYTDATNLTAMETELASRNSATRMIDGVYFTAKQGTLSALSTFGSGRNSPHVTCLGSPDVLEPTYEVASEYAGQVSAEGSTDPARPFQTLQLINSVPVPVVERFDYSERNSLLFDGVATLKIDSAGIARIERGITMYQKNGSGADDIAYLDVNTLLILMYIRFDWRNSINTKYPRAKLANDGVKVKAGMQVMTPKVGKAEAIAKFRQWEYLGLVENIDQFKNDLVCVRSESDPNRLEWILPPDLMNQFRVAGTTIQFLLQSPAV